MPLFFGFKMLTSIIFQHFFMTHTNLYALVFQATCQASTSTGPVRAFMASLDRSAQLLGPRDAVSQRLGKGTPKKHMPHDRTNNGENMLNPKNNRNNKGS